MPETRDSLIVRIVEKGDPQSWKEFFATYQPYVQNVIRRYGLSDHDASDAAQDAFVAILRALPKFTYRAERGRFRGWLKTIVQRVVIDQIRRRRRTAEVAIELDSFSAPMDSAADLPGEGGDRAYAENVLQQALDRVRSRSSTATWSCFEEHFLKQRTAAEVGQELGLNPGAVYMNSSRVYGRVCANASSSLKKL